MSLNWDMNSGCGISSTCLNDDGRGREFGVSVDDALAVLSNPNISNIGRLARSASFSAANWAMI